MPLSIVSVLQPIPKRSLTDIYGKHRRVILMVHSELESLKFEHGPGVLLLRNTFIQGLPGFPVFSPKTTVWFVMVDPLTRTVCVVNIISSILSSIGGPFSVRPS